MTLTYVYLMAFFFSVILLSLIFWERAWEKRILIVFISSVFAFIPNTIFNGLENNRLKKSQELMKVKEIFPLDEIDSTKVYVEFKLDSTALNYSNLGLFEDYLFPEKWEVKFNKRGLEEIPRTEIYASVAQIEKNGWSSKKLMPKTNRKRIIYLPKDSIHMEIVRIWKLKNKKDEEKDNS